MASTIWRRPRAIGRGADLTGDGVADLVVTDSDRQVAFLVDGTQAFVTAALETLAIELDHGRPLHDAGT